MDVVGLARLPFSIPFLILSIAIGLSLPVAVLETFRWRRGDDVSRRAVTFWRRVFAITFTAGVVAGIVAQLEIGSAAVLDPSTLLRFAHAIAASFTCAAFLMIGVSARYLLQRRHARVARLSLQLGTVTALLGIVLSFATGDRNARRVAQTQPARFAAMEGLSSTTNGAPLVLFSLPPTQRGGRSGPELTVTRLTSLLAFGSFEAPVKGLSEFPREAWPPVAVTFLSFHNMVILGTLMLLEALAGAWLLLRGRLETTRWWLRTMVLSTPLPALALLLGWMAAEAGRRPAITSRLDSRASLFAAVYLVLGVAWVFLIRREIRRGPEEPFSGVFAPLGPEEALRA